MPATDDVLIPCHAAKPRQCGKTTLVRGFAVAERRYISLDDETALTAAVLRDGDAVIGFGDHLFAAPPSCLWRSGPRGP